MGAVCHHVGKATLTTLACLQLDSATSSALSCHLASHCHPTPPRRRPTGLERQGPAFSLPCSCFHPQDPCAPFSRTGGMIKQTILLREPIHVHSQHTACPHEWNGAWGGTGEPHLSACSGHRPTCAHCCARHMVTLLEGLWLLSLLVQESCRAPESELNHQAQAEPSAQDTNPLNPPAYPGETEAGKVPGIQDPARTGRSLLSTALPPRRTQWQWELHVV